LEDKEVETMTSFKDYPQEEYDHKKPWYEWMKDQLAKKDAWKKEMEEELQKIAKEKLVVSIPHVQGRIDLAKELLGEEVKK
jgi:hypothetical protein